MNTTLAHTLGKTARAARESLGLTQQDTAERVGVSTEFYARIERGGALPSVPTLIGLAESLGVSADSLLGIGPTPPASGVREPRTPWQPSESPDVRRLIRRVRKARLRTVRLLNLLALELERRR